MTEKENIIIGVCTANRPRMLSNCLASLKELEIADNISLTLMVVENSEVQKSKEVVDGFINDFPYPFIYLHEPIRGIPFARNRVVDKALELNSDWIAFIDDDEVADKKWIKNLLSEAEKYQADVIKGKVIPIYPEPRPFWIVDLKKKVPSDGYTLFTAATNNLLFSKKLFKDWGMKFDETLRFTGGEDTDYFCRAYDKGAKIIYTDSPIVLEEVPPSRCTYLYQFRRRVRNVGGDIIMKKNHTDYFCALKAYMPKFLRNLRKSIFRLIACPFSIFFGLETFKRTTLNLGLNIAVMVAYILAVFNIRLQPYKTIDGD